MKERKMKKLRSVVLLAATAFSFTAISYAQDTTKQTVQGAPQKSAAKPRKVWTDDDLGSLRRTSVITTAAAQTETVQNDAAKAQPAASNGAVTAKPRVKDHPPLLSDPKTVEDADRMIDWEKRDIDSQQEYVDRLQSQLETAAPDQREHLQQLIAERQQIVADTRREQQELVAQRKALQKKGAAGNDNVASSQSPQ
jgi:hypothetical protein